VPKGNECSSACFLLFACGEPRFAHATARIGIHSARNRENQEDATSYTIDTWAGRLLKACGVPEYLIGKMITTPAEEMYWLTLEDLRAMNVHIDGQIPQVESRAKRPFRITEKADGGYLNLRSGPGMNYDVIAQMPVGTTVLMGNCVRLEGGLLPFCEVEWLRKHGWASSCCMADLGGLGSPQPPLLRPQVPRKCGAGPRLQVAGCYLSGYHPLDCLELRRQLQEMHHCEW
jgi:hypothetical protein